MDAIKVYKDIFNYIKPNEHGQLVENYYLIGENFMNARVVDSADFYFKKGDKLYNDSLGLNFKALKYLNKSDVFYFKNEIDSSMAYALKADKVSKKINEDKLSINVKLFIAEIFFKQRNYEKSIEYFNDVMRLSKMTNDSITKHEVINFLAQIDIEEGRFELAENRLKQTTIFFKKLDFTRDIFISKAATSKLYLKTGRFDDAAKMSFELLSLMNKFQYTGKSKQQIDNVNKLSEKLDNQNLNIKEISEAENIVKKNIEIALNPSLSTQAKEAFAIYQEQSPNAIDSMIDLNKIFENRHKTIEELLNEKDSIYGENLKMKYDELEQKYKTKEKEEQNQRLRAEKAEAQTKAEVNKTQKIIFISISLLLALLLFIFYNYAKHKKKDMEFQSKLNVLKAKQEEQENIGIELHDNIAKQLEKVEIKLNKLGEDDVALETNSIKNKIRTLSRELSLVSFEESSFTEQIINLVVSYHSDALQIKINGLNDIDWKKIANPIKYNILMIVNEAISNSYNYSDASLINVDFTKLKQHINVNIKDNGIGFDEKNITYGRGFRNMKIRVNDMNGDLKIKSTPNKGTNIFLQVSLA